ncbi:MAG: penicillin-binding protein [Cytophaga sp.]|nr:penicillin-binding protein [Cytophaga sp.]
MRRLFLITSLLLFFAFNHDCAQAQIIEQKIDSLFAEYNTPTTPGVAVVVVQNGTVVFKKGYGMANLEYNIPITTQTGFHVASVSKQFTAFAIYLLKQQGKISLEDDVRKYIPELPVYNKIIRIKHLLAHTSGLRDQWATLTLAGWQMEDIITTEQIIKLACRQKSLNFETGTQFGYCNTGYTLLAEIVSRVTQHSFADFTTHHIFQPLGMTNTRFNDDFHNVIRNSAHSYELRQDQFIERRLNYATVGATSLVTTAEDLALWVNNFRQPVVGDVKLINEFNQNSLLDNGKPVVWSASPGDTVYHAKGQLNLYYKGLQRTSHGGHDAGFRAVLLRFPEENLAVITLSNNEHYTMLAKANPVVDIYLKDQIKESAVATPNFNSNHIDPNIASFKNELHDFTGIYTSDELATTYMIKKKGDQLIMTHNRCSDMILQPEGEDIFSGVNTFSFQLKFIRTRHKVTGFEISNFGAKEVKFNRKKQ